MARAWKIPSVVCLFCDPSSVRRGGFPTSAGPVRQSFVDSVLWWRGVCSTRAPSPVPTLPRPLTQGLPGPLPLVPPFRLDPSQAQGLLGGEIQPFAFPPCSST